MFYHFNRVSDNDFDITTTIRTEKNDHEDFSSSDEITHEIRKVQGSFAEKYQSIKERNYTILQIVFPTRSTVRFFLYIFFFISYLYIGAFAIKTLEIDKEIEDRRMFQKVRDDFLNGHKCISDEDLEKFIEIVEKLASRGISPTINGTSLSYKWDIPNGVFFVTTLVTTIGYGNDKPVTERGKIFCIFFVIFGVPMMMILSSAVVERVFALVDLSFSALFHKHNCTMSEEKFRQIQLIVCCLIFVIFFILIPSWIFVITEKGSWRFIDAAYYCVISMTTIGLGDLVPGDGDNILDRSVSKILVTVYLFLGLTMAAFCIRVYHRFHRWNLGSSFIYLESEPNVKVYYNPYYSITDNENWINSFKHDDLTPLLRSSIRSIPETIRKSQGRSRFYTLM